MSMVLQLHMIQDADSDGKEKQEVFAIFDDTDFGNDEEAEQRRKVRDVCIPTHVSRRFCTSPLCTRTFHVPSLSHANTTSPSLSLSLSLYLSLCVLLAVSCHQQVPPLEYIYKFVKAVSDCAQFSAECNIISLVRVACSPSRCLPVCLHALTVRGVNPFVESRYSQVRLFSRPCASHL
jgi:hypothetical protein